MKLKFVEIGKVMLVWGILKNVTQVMQRVVFLHEDLVKLPSFPRKALEAELPTAHALLVYRVDAEHGRAAPGEGRGRGSRLEQPAPVSAGWST